MVGCQAPTQPLACSPPQQGRKEDRKACGRRQGDHLPITIMGKTGKLIYCLLKWSWMVRNKDLNTFPCSAPPLPPFPLLQPLELPLLPQPQCSQGCFSQYFFFLPHSFCLFLCFPSRAPVLPRGSALPGGGAAGASPAPHHSSPPAHAWAPAAGTALVLIER